MNSLYDNSHQLLSIMCEAKCSNKCVGTVVRQYRDIVINRKRNNGKYICLYCSRFMKFSGRNNPNCKIKSLDDSFFNTINSEFKAYVLGWIISDGNIRQDSIAIQIHERDAHILNTIAHGISRQLTVKHYPQKHQIKLLLCSSQMVIDVCRHLNIQPGKKCDIVQFPVLTTETLQLACIRGIFDGDGTLRNPARDKKSYLTAKITSTSKDLLGRIETIVGIPCHRGKKDIEWSCNNALDFLNKIYHGAEFYLDRKFELYCLWCNYIPGIQGTCKHLNQMRCLKTRSDGVIPHKARASDAGYDLTIIEKIRQVGDVEFYTTGIKIQMDMGWMGLIYPRSSISKTGYMLANSVGVIDRSYLGELIIALRKVDQDALDLELPLRVAQIVPYPIVHFDVVEVDDFEDTTRGEGGFGSSGK